MKVPIESSVVPLGAGRQRPSWAFPATVTFIYLAIATYAICHHEMWRDELHCWLVARDSSAPWQVVSARAYDGQPPLWYLLLWVLTRITWHPQMMQIAHVGIAAVNVLLVCRFAPFSRTARTLFAFGYFALYEYAVISRCYGLALLFVILLCIHHPRRFERPLATGVLLAALGLTTTVATLVASSYILTLAVETWRRWRCDPRIRGRAILAVAIGSLGVLAAALCAWPPADSTVARLGRAPALPWDFGPTRVVAAFIPIPSPEFFFWNSNALLDALGSPWFGLALASALVAAALWLLSGHPSSVLLFAVASGLLICLFAGVYSGDTRHHGFIFVAFFMASWIAVGQRSTLRLQRAITIAFAVHVPGAAIAIAFDARYIFSSGARAAHELRRRGLDNSPIVAEVDYPATAVLGQLGPHAVAFSPRTGRTFSFVRWTADRFWNPTDTQTLQYASGLGATLGKDAVLLMNRPLQPELIGPRVERIAELYDSMIEEENFYIYRVTQDARAPTDSSSRPTLGLRY